MQQSSRPSSETVEAWLRDEAKGLRALARSLLADENDADDAVQDTWVAALRSQPERPGPWMHVVLRRLAFRHARTERRRRRREGAAARAEAIPSVGDVVAGLDLRRRVVEAVATLEEPYRSAVVLHYFHDQSPVEVARIQGVPLPTAKTRLHRALARLRAHLDEEHGGRRAAWQAPLALLVNPSMGAAAAGYAAAGGAVLALKKVVAVLVLALMLGAAADAVWELAVAALPDANPAPASAVAAVPAAPVLRGRPTALFMAPPAGEDWVLREGAAVPDATFAGRVLDEQGVGIEGAVVRLHWYSPRSDTAGPAITDHLLFLRERERREAPAFTTNREGYFRLVRPYTSISYLRVDARGFATAVTQGPSGRYLLVRLKRKDALAVRVLSQEGAVIPGAEVRLVSRWDFGGVPDRKAREVLASATTDSAGRADLPTASDDQYGLEVVPAEPRLGIVELKQVENGAREIEVCVPPVTTSVRHVVDADTGRPLADAYADVLHDFWSFGTYSTDLLRRRIQADREGRLEVPLQDETNSIVSAPGYEVAVPWVDDPIRLTPAMRIEGTVKSAEGVPVRDAGLFLVIPGVVPYATAYMGASPLAAFTDAEGRFDLEVKQGWPPYGERKPDRGLRALVAAHPDHLAAAIEPSIPVVSGTRVRVDLRFPRPAAFDVLVVDAQSRPVPGKWVSARRLLPWPATWPMPKDRNGVRTTSLVRPGLEVETDAHGRARLDGLSPGPHEVRVENASVDAEAVEGKATQVRVALGAGPSITGRVVTAAGQPAATIGLRLGGANRVASAVTDSEGRFRFEDLPDGDYQIFLSHPVLGPRQQLTRWARPGDDVSLRIPAGLARLRLHLEGVPKGAGEFQLLTSTGGYLTNQDETTQRQTSFIAIPSSPYETEGFVPGPGRVLLRAEGFGMRMVAFEAPELATTDVRVGFEPPGKIAGRVLVPSAAKHEIVILRAVLPGPDAETDRWIQSRTQMRTEIGEDRTFRFAALQPGSYDLKFWRRDDGEWTQGAPVRIEVHSGQTTRAELGM